MYHLSFCAWLVSFSAVSSKFIHVVACIRISFLFKAAAAKSLQSHLTLCNPIDSSPRGSSVPGILQARIPEWVAISFSKVYTAAAAAAAKSLQSCLTLCDPIDGSPRGSSVPGILQTRILEWVAISFSNAACVLSRFSHV